LTQILGQPCEFQVFYDGLLAKLARAEPQRDAMLAAIAANTK
jgi:hypothetical protein